MPRLESVDIPYPFFTTNWFQYHIANWTKILVPLFQGKPNLRFLEIGSYEGQSALWTVENLLTGYYCVLHCVDTFKGSMELDVVNIDLYGRFKYNLGKYYVNGPVVVHQKTSREFFQDPRIRGNWDMVYIDGSHVAKDVLHDILSAWPYIKNKGVMVMDDYQWQGFEQDMYKPQLAIEAFLRCYADEYRLLHAGAQIMVMKETQNIPPIPLKKEKNSN